MKTTKEMIEVMQAHEDGKTIQARYIYNEDWWFDISTPSWDWDEYDYRIKPEPKKPTYRPYESVDEMLSDYKCRVRKINNQPKNTMPLIWLKCSETGAERLATGFDREGNNVFVGYWRDMSELYTDYHYLDGTPVGKLVEEMSIEEKIETLQRVVNEVYIKLASAFRAFDACTLCDDYSGPVEEVTEPTVEAQSAVHGHWNKMDNVWECSE